MSIYFFGIVNIGIYKTFKGSMMLAFYFLFLERFLSTVLCFIIVCLVYFFIFVVWFATIEKAEVPPPAGKGMNHKWGRGAVSAPKKT